ncbi:hypothetical protein JCM19232_918 [Vibrio ishigakensis]|uniref:Uncharacterized protein n=1 Tax=Vibrio ishigakensis TaxID=1481914 RepID=A0A0B8PM84_9VIBR|nr:hypothetical protein JCM19232_918 [Vibrio ishigakensis]
MIFSALESGSAMTTVFVAAAPFVIVALCEFSKIPLALATWHARKSKLLYMILILIVSFITFETLFNGFERNFAALTFSAEKLEIKRDGYEANIMDNQSKIAEMEKEYQQEKGDIQNQMQENSEKRSASRASAKVAVERNNRSLASNRQTLGVLQGELQGLNQEKADLLQKLTVEKQSALEERSKNISNRDTVRQEQIQSLERKLERLRSQMMTEVDDAFWSVDKQRIRKDYETQIVSLQGQLNKLVDGGLEVNKDASFTFSAIDEQYKLMLEMVDDKISLKESEINKLEVIIGAQQRAVSSSLAARNRQIDSTFISEKTRLESMGEKVETEFDSTREEIDAIKEENFDIKQKIRHLDTDIEQMYLSNQIYRMASHIDGTKELDEIDPTTVTIVAVVWFGSLAFICAIIGPILVLASLHLKTRSEKLEQEQGELSLQAK